MLSFFCHDESRYLKSFVSATLEANLQAADRNTCVTNLLAGSCSTVST
jgi:hypothetical protein